MCVAVCLAAARNGSDVDQVVGLVDDEPRVQGAVNRFVIDDVHLGTRGDESG